MKHESKVLFDSTKYEWEEVAPGVSRQITGYNDTIMMVLVKFEKDAIGTAHSHPHSQSTYVESGEFEVQMGDKIQVLKKGDCFIAPPDTIHGVVCKSAGMLVDVFSPVREDFL
jgi:quercetin dioxygenase-like cupin family protein